MTASRTTFSYLTECFFWHHCTEFLYCAILDQLIYYKFFLLTQINWWFRVFLVSHHIYFNFNIAKTTECMHWRCGGWFYVSSFFYITILLESKNRPLKPPFVLIFAILLISIKPRASEQSLWEIRAKVRKGGTNDHWETKKRKMSSLRNCHRVRRRARLLNSTQYGHHDLNKKVKKQRKHYHSIKNHIISV